MHFLEKSAQKYGWNGVERGGMHFLEKSAQKCGMHFLEKSAQKMWNGKIIMKKAVRRLFSFVLLRCYHGIITV